MLLARLLIPAQICFGPIMGVIASGLIYGSDDAHLWGVGTHLLNASIWVSAWFSRVPFSCLVELTFGSYCIRVVASGCTL